MSKKKTISAGAIPKLKKSDSESSSIPKLELLLNKRANFPSILSKNEAKTIKETEISHLLSIANFIDVRPKVSEIKVTIFGINLTIESFFMIFNF